MSDKNPLARHGGLSYLEIPTSDPARSAAFYQQIAGWKVDQRSARDFRYADGGGLLIGRFVDGRPASPAPALLPYLYVDDVAAAVALAGSLGGETVKPVTPEGDILVAQIRDPSGNVIGLWQFSST
jgi:predicted enzyme related to lactoylglutathione lyase